MRRYLLDRDPRGPPREAPVGGEPRLLLLLPPLLLLLPPLLLLLFPLLLRERRRRLRQLRQRRQLQPPPLLDRPRRRLRDHVGEHQEVRLDFRAAEGDVEGVGRRAVCKKVERGAASEGGSLLFELAFVFFFVLDAAAVLALVALVVVPLVPLPLDAGPGHRQRGRRLFFFCVFFLRFLFLTLKRGGGKRVES